MARFDALFALRPSETTPEKLAAAFTVEAIHWNVPENLYRTLVNFRKLRQDGRVSAARSYLKRQAQKP